MDKNSIGKLSIEVVGVADANNAPDLKADTGYVYEDFTLTVADGASANDGLDSSPFTGIKRLQQILILIVIMEIIREIY